MRDVVAVNEFTDPVRVTENGDSADAVIALQPTAQALTNRDEYIMRSLVAMMMARSWAIPRTSDASASTYSALCWDPVNACFVGVIPGTATLKSNGRDDWTNGAVAPENNSWSGICASASGVVAVAASGTNRTMRSTDGGASWTVHAAAEANQWSAVCFSPTLGTVGRLVAVANTGTHRVMTSDDDGLTWSTQTAAEANSWSSVCWSEDLAKYCAVSTDGTHRVMTSADGLIWTAQTAAEANAWRSVCWSSRMQLFIAVSTAGTHRIMTSPDGVTWSVASHPATFGSGEHLVAVSAGDPVGVVIAVCDDGFYTWSIDGTEWFHGVSVDPDNASWSCVAWSPDQSYFAAAGIAGERVMVTQ